MVLLEEEREKEIEKERQRDSRHTKTQTERSHSINFIERQHALWIRSRKFNSMRIGFLVNWLQWGYVHFVGKDC